MKALLVANTDWYLYNFRLALADALRERGVDVVLVCPLGDHAGLLRQRGYRVVEWRLNKGSLSPLFEVPALLRLWRIYRRERPDLAHNFTIKANVYGSIAGRLAGVPHIVDTWTGLGYPFEPGPAYRLFRLFLTPIMWAALRSRRTWHIFQNAENLDLFAKLHIVSRDQTVTILGSGVDTERFAPSAGRDPDSRLSVLMAARLLRDKGVAEYVEAARHLRRGGLDADFLLAGAPDERNPAAIEEARLAAWREAGDVTFLGHRDDVPELMRQADVAVLPSYHEGLSRFLLEAAASGLPLVASDIEGCRPVVQHGENGYLVPPRDGGALAEAIGRLLSDTLLRKRFGTASRALAVDRFSDERNIQENLAVYERMGALS